MTQGWVVYGGMRHAEPQREMFPRSYPLTTHPWVTIIIIIITVRVIVYIDGIVVIIIA
jgi:hypothetical protein